MSQRPSDFDRQTERMLGFAAWLGAMIARIESGQPPLPHINSANDDPRESYYEEQGIRADAKHFIKHDRQHLAYSDPENWKPSPYSEAIANLLRSLHGSVRNQSWEEEFWGWIIRFCPTGLPDSILDYLIENEIEICALCHGSHEDKFHWKLIQHWDEALLTLANRRYLSSDYTPDQFEEILHQFPTHEWMLTNLIRISPDCAEKAELLAKYVREHPDQDKLIEKPSPAFAKAWESAK